MDGLIDNDLKILSFVLSLTLINIDEETFILSPDKLNIKSVDHKLWAHCASQKTHEISWYSLVKAIAPHTYTNKYRYVTRWEKNTLSSQSPKL